MIMRSHLFAPFMLVCLLTGITYDQAAVQTLGMSSPANKMREAEKRAQGTVVVGVAVAEGLVLVGDSRVTLQSDSWVPPYKIVSDSQNKVMAVGNIGIATFGQAFILGRSINSWVQDFGFELRKRQELDTLTLEKFLEEFKKYFAPKVEEHRNTNPSHGVGFLVAGYDAAGVGRIYLLGFPDPEPIEKTNTKNNPGMTWQGETDTIQRIIKGVDLSRLSQLKQYRQMKDSEKKNLLDGLGGLEYLIFYKYLSLQDAIDLAIFLVEATVTMQRFSFGTVEHPGSLPDVGGPVDSIVITPTGLRQVRQKRLLQPTKAED